MPQRFYPLKNICFSDFVFFRKIKKKSFLKKFGFNDMSYKPNHVLIGIPKKLCLGIVRYAVRLARKKATHYKQRHSIKHKHRFFFAKAVVSENLRCLLGNNI